MVRGHLGMGGGLHRVPGVRAGFGGPPFPPGRTDGVPPPVLRNSGVRVEASVRADEVDERSRRTRSGGGTLSHGSEVVEYGPSLPGRGSGVGWGSMSGGGSDGRVCSVGVSPHGDHPCFPAHFRSCLRAAPGKIIAEGNLPLEADGSAEGGAPATFARLVPVGTIEGRRSISPASG